jgi:RNA polymerase subunit RPABC4/transcription elongation factor Spt4
MRSSDVSYLLCPTGRARSRTRLLPAGKTLFPSTFSDSVPSLSWQIHRLHMNTAQTKAVFRTDNSSAMACCAATGYAPSRRRKSCRVCGRRAAAAAWSGLIPARSFAKSARSDSTLSPAKNGIFEPFIYINDNFAKTGSGQT